MRQPYRVALSADARHDMRGAADYYDRQRDGLGERYLREVVDALDVIVERPLSFPIVHRDMRRATLRHFPHGVFFRIQRETIRVMAVVDMRRHPRTWRQRG